MALSTGIAIVQRWWDDQWWQFTPPFPTAGNDPGWGGGGSHTLTIQKDGRYHLGYLPGFSYANYWPNPTLQAGQLDGTEVWYPHGLHNYGRVAYSPSLGVVISNATGLSADGRIGLIHMCFPWFNRLGHPRTRWTHIGNPGDVIQGGSQWSQYFGYDIALKRDLVTWRNQLYELIGTYVDAQDSRRLPVLGTRVFDGSSTNAPWFGDPATGQTIENRIQLPWRREWWIWNAGNEGAPGTLYVFRLATNSWTTIPLPAEVQARLASRNGANLAIATDMTNRRVIAAQCDVMVAPTIVEGAERYPLVLWQIDTSNYSFTRISLAAPILITRFDKAVVAPLSWNGGERFMFWDPWNLAYAMKPATDGTAAGSPWPVSEGGFKPKEIFIPRARAPRQITWTPRTFPTTFGNYLLDNFNSQKHVEYAYRPTDGRVYAHGGDKTGSSDSNILSFQPESPASLRIDKPACPATPRFLQPRRPDENGWQYRAVSDDFWHAPGYNFGSFPMCDVMSDADWQSLGGGEGKLWRWNPRTGIYTTFDPVFVPDPAVARQFTSTFPAGEYTAKRWYYDPGTDVLVRPVFSDGSVALLDCATLTFRRAFAKFEESARTQRRDGSEITSWGMDRAALDPATGRLYCSSGIDVWEIDTRAAFSRRDLGYGQTVSVLPARWKFAMRPGQWNLTHMVWAQGALWIVISSRNLRIRCFSWAPGEVEATEHPTPLAMIGTAAVTYRSGSSDRILVVGNLSAGAAGIGNLNSYHTGVIS